MAPGTCPASSSRPPLPASSRPSSRRTGLADDARYAPRDYTPRDWAAHPPLIAPDYKSTRLRGTTKPLIPIRQSLSELTGPVFGQDSLGPLDHDLTRNGRKEGEPPGEPPGEPIGERIVEIGRAHV